jgi:hypothetical protein
MKWVVDTDEYGIRRLCMRWTVAPLPAVGKAKWPCVEPEIGRVRDPAINPRARVAIP